MSHEPFGSFHPNKLRQYQPQEFTSSVKSGSTSDRFIYGLTGTEIVPQFIKSTTEVCTGYLGQPFTLCFVFYERLYQVASTTPPPGSSKIREVFVNICERCMQQSCYPNIEIAKVGPGNKQREGVLSTMYVRSLQKAAPILACSILEERVRHRPMRATADHSGGGHEVA